MKAYGSINDILTQQESLIKKTKQVKLMDHNNIATSASTQKRIVIDITTLIKWNRPPVGITRILFEITYFALRHYPNTLCICLDLQKNEMISITHDEVLMHLNRLSKSQGARRNIFFSRARFKLRFWLNCLWNIAFNTFRKAPHCFNHFLKKYLSTKYYQKLKNLYNFLGTKLYERHLHAKNLFFEIDKTVSNFKCPLTVNDYYFSLGLDWDFSNYELLYALKSKINFTFVGIFHDSIPIYHPELLSSPYFAQVFFFYLYYLVNLADKLNCVSNYSRNELTKIMDTCFGKAHPKLAVINLGCNLPQYLEDTQTRLDLNIPPEPFIIYVSTIEPRKNHRLLFETWKLVHAKLEEQTPSLILVGMVGWGVHDLLSEIQTSPLFGKKIFIHNNLSDAHLSILYRTCLFTVFPSLFEGWGLGAVESLSYGKICLISTAEALQEATQGLMPALSPTDPQIWANEICRLVSSPSALKNLEAIIQQKFIYRSWEQFANEFIDFGLGIEK